MANEVIEFFNQSDTTLPDINETLVGRVIIKIFSDSSHRFDWLNIIFLSDDEHTEMNAQYLDHHYSTDILTFEFKENNCMNGEIYINTATAQQNAKEYAVTFKNEIQRLIIHGALHLTGKKDSTQIEKSEMKTSENHYLDLLNH